jgi:hypothetical protein
MTDLIQLYDDETRDAFDQETLREARTVAELAVNGVIPHHQLPRLHLYLDGEMPQLVAEAMEAMK